MAEQGDPQPQGVFEVIWHQHNPNDWMAEVRDTLTGQRCRVYSLEDLERFIHAHLRTGARQPAEPRK